MLKEKCPNRDDAQKQKEIGPLTKKHEEPSPPKVSKPKPNPNKPQIKKPNTKIIPKKPEFIISFKNELTQRKIKPRNNPNDNTPKSKKEKNESHLSAKSEKNTKNKTINKIAKYQLKKKKKSLLYNF